MNNGQVKVRYLDFYVIQMFVIQIPLYLFLQKIEKKLFCKIFQEDEENKRGRRSGRHNALPALDESSSGSRDDSRLVNLYMPVTNC